MSDKYVKESTVRRIGSRVGYAKYVQTRRSGYGMH